MSDPKHYSILLLIDRSASIKPFEEAMTRGIGNVIAAEAERPGLTTISIAQFDHELKWTHTLEAPGAVDVRVRARGKTALHDAIGLGILGLRESIGKLPEHARPAWTQVIVLTDGRENASTEFDLASVRRLVLHQRQEHNWDFRLFAANQDSALTGNDLGFAGSEAFEAPQEGTLSMTTEVFEHIESTRRRQPRSTSSSTSR